MTNHSRDTNQRSWPALLLLALLSPACATDVPLDVYADAGSEELSVAPGDDPMPDIWDAGHIPSEPEAEVLDDEPSDDPPEELSEAEIHDLAFGDSGWDCCYTDICQWMRDNKCTDGEVPTTNGIGTYCCLFDIGQCPESGWDDADAGTE